MNTNKKQATGYRRQAAGRRLRRAARLTSQASGLTPRSGSTLTEVLMSILIMSIGIVSIATMFPLSVMRAAKATQLTVATDLRYNAEAMLDLNPRMIFDPDNALGTGPDGAGINYMIDPLGYAAIQPIAGAGGIPANAQNFFGINVGAGTSTTLARWPFRTTDFVMMPDSWELLHEGNFITTLPSTGTFLAVSGLDASGIATTPGVRYRAVIFNADGTASHIRQITGTLPNIPTTPDRISWNETTDLNGNGALDQYALPTGFVAGKVRIESQEQRYTWMLTVRKTAAYAADLDLVTFFKRSADNPLDQEAAWPLGGVGLVTTSPNLTVTPGGGTTLPTVKRGNYMLDVNNARWYRVSAAEVNTAGAGLDVRLERNPTAVSTGRVIFPKAVVDVYPLGIKTYTLP